MKNITIASFRYPDFTVCPGQTILQTAFGQQPVNISSPNYPGRLSWIDNAMQCMEIGELLSLCANFSCLWLRYYLDYYGVSENEEWTIVVPAGQIVRLNFYTFKTESRYDPVRVYDGCTVNDPRIGSFSGSSIPNSILSTRNVLHITFKSDSGASFQGFSALASGLGNRMLLHIIFYNDYHV